MWESTEMKSGISIGRGDFMGVNLVWVYAFLHRT